MPQRVRLPGDPNHPVATRPPISLLTQEKGESVLPPDAVSRQDQLSSVFAVYFL